MPFTGDSLTITAEENSSKRLLVLHKSETGLKIERVCVGEGERFSDAEDRRESSGSEREIYRMDQQKHFKVKGE